MWSDFFLDYLDCLLMLRLLLLLIQSKKLRDCVVCMCDYLKEKKVKKDGNKNGIDNNVRKINKVLIFSKNSNRFL